MGLLETGTPLRWLVDQLGASAAREKLLDAATTLIRDAPLANVALRIAGR
jgi:hypothetical protein